MEHDVDAETSAWDGMEAIGFWLVLSLVLIVVLSIVYRTLSKWAEIRYSADEVGRSERLQQARSSLLDSLEKEMEAFKQTGAYKEMQQASANMQNTTILPEHRGVIKRGASSDNPSWKPSIQSRYCSRKKG